MSESLDSLQSTSKIMDELKCSKCIGILYLSLCLFIFITFVSILWSLLDFCQRKHERHNRHQGDK